MNSSLIDTDVERRRLHLHTHTHSSETHTHTDSIFSLLRHGHFFFVIFSVCPPLLPQLLPSFLRRHTEIVQLQNKTVKIKKKKKTNNRQFDSQTRLTSALLCIRGVNSRVLHDQRTRTATENYVRAVHMKRQSFFTVTFTERLLNDATDWQISRD